MNSKADASVLYRNDESLQDDWAPQRNGATLLALTYPQYCTAGSDNKSREAVECRGDIKLQEGQEGHSLIMVLTLSQRQ